jgi:TldD protein
MGCTFLGPGTLHPREVIENTPRGILVRRLEAATAHPESGTARFRVTDADQIRDGKLGFPLEPFLFKVSAEQALSGLERIADDLTFDTCIGSCIRDGQPLATSVGAPTCRIGVVTVFL